MKDYREATVIYCPDGREQPTWAEAVRRERVEEWERLNPRPSSRLPGGDGR